MGAPCQAPALLAHPTPTLLARSTQLVHPPCRRTAPCPALVPLPRRSPTLLAQSTRPVRLAPRPTAPWQELALDLLPCQLARRLRLLPPRCLPPRPSRPTRP